MSADEIRRELEAVRIEGRRLAAQQQAWRRQMSELYERARAAGLSHEEVVEGLGLTAKWAQHLSAHERMRIVLDSRIP